MNIIKDPGQFALKNLSHDLYHQFYKTDSSLDHFSALIIGLVFNSAFSFYANTCFKSSLLCSNQKRIKRFAPSKS